MLKEFSALAALDQYEQLGKKQVVVRDSSSKWVFGSRELNTNFAKRTDISN
jgi:hypothetical protein